MGTKKGQVRKTARRAYEPKKKKFMSLTYFDVVSGKKRTIQVRRKK